MSGRTLTPPAYRTPEEVDNFQKSNLGVRMLLSRLLGLRRARRTGHGEVFALASYFACIGTLTTNGAGAKAAVLLHLAARFEQTVFALNLVCGNQRGVRADAVHDQKRTAISVPRNASA